MEVTVDQPRHREQPATVDRPRVPRIEPVGGVAPHPLDAVPGDDDVGVVVFRVLIVEREHARTPND